MGEEMGKEALLGRLRDEGFSPVLVNRMDELLEVFNGNIPQFIIATRGQLNAAYNKTHPGEKSIGAKTYAVFDRFVQLWKQSRLEVRQVARAAEDERERREAERASMRSELLERDIDFDAMTAAMAALGTLGLRQCALGKLLEMHDMAKGAKA